MSDPRIIPLGEGAFIVRLSDKLDREVNSRARALADAIQRAAPAGLTDVVAANSSVGVYFDHVDRGAEHQRMVAELLNDQLPGALSNPRVHELPVRYDGADLSDVAAMKGLSAQQVIEIHSSVDYQVFAIGFAPGFAYMGEVDERISVPRRANPRTAVPQGSVAIANRQTAIYPFATPGGWNIIGTTPVLPFDIERDPNALFRVGDRVRFVPA